MRFRKSETTQDVIVSCCILHNMRKQFRRKTKHYSALELGQQQEISDRLPRNQQRFRLQDFLINSHFH